MLDAILVALNMRNQMSNIFNIYVTESKKSMKNNNPTRFGIRWENPNPPKNYTLENEVKPNTHVRPCDIGYNSKL